MSFFKTKDYSEPECVKTVYRSGKKQSEENLNKSIRNNFKLKKEHEETNDRIIRDIRALFKQEDNYYKPTRIGNFWNNFISNMKYIENKLYQIWN